MAGRELSIGPHAVGEDRPPYTIAEAGVHHYNSIELAKAYILEARSAGASAIKFQTYRAERLATRWAPAYWHDEQGRTQFEVFAGRDRLSEAGYSELIAYADEVGITFLSTPFDPDSAALLNDLGVPAFKIASADITHLPLLRAVGAFGKPVLLSTGASEFDEVRRAVDELAPFEVPVALLHCSLSYPTAIADANLERIVALGRAFPDLVIGYSDHTRPQDSALACPLSVALGARIIEKHFTLNKRLPGDDHDHAVDPEGLRRLVADCRDAYLMTRPYVELHETEAAARSFARRSIVAARPIRAGEAFTWSNLDFKRPGTGISPSVVERLLNRSARRSYEADDPIGAEELE